MSTEQIARLIHRIAHTHDDEIDCGDGAELSPQIVDALLAEQDAAERWALLQQHLEQCSTCEQEFVLLMNCAEMEANGTWPTISYLLEQATRRDLNA